LVYPYLPILRRNRRLLIIICIGEERRLTIQNKTSVSYILSGCELGSVPIKSALGSEEISSPSKPGGCVIPLLSKLNFFERSWKSVLRFSTISSNAARCALTNVRVVGAGELTVDASSEEGDFIGGVKDKRMAVPFVSLI
jgi:hypothetical protein